MTPAERNELCEKHRLGVHWVKGEWIVEEAAQPWDILAKAPHRDAAIDLAADRLAERGAL